MNLVKILVDIIPVALGLLAIFSLGFLGVYAGFESGELTLLTLPIWIWKHGVVFYFFIAAITAGHALAALLVVSNSNKDSEKKKERTKKIQKMKRLEFFFVL